MHKRCGILSSGGGVNRYIWG